MDETLLRRQNMKMKQHRKDEALAMLAVITGLAVWVILVITKMIGGFPTLSWLLVCCGFAWIPAVLTAAAFLIRWTCSLTQKLLSIKTQLSTCRTLKIAMHGMTLNTIGPVYGVERQPGEPNHIYEIRILKAAVSTDKIRMKRTPAPVTGERLDEIAKKNGLARRKNESDAHLQNRVREAVMKRLDSKLEGGKL